MTLAVEPEVKPFVPPLALLKRFTVEEYHRALPAFREDERVELLEGWIVYKMTHNPLHDSTVDRVQEVLRDHVPRDRRVRVQSAITTKTSEPEPDIVIARGPASRYTKNHPGPADIALIIEVADSSLERDRIEKAPLYARAGIETYWIINLAQSVIEVFSRPTSGRSANYPKPKIFSVKDSIPLSIAGKSLSPIPVKELLP